MKNILFVLLSVFLFSYSANGQGVYTVECFCGWLSGSDCLTCSGQYKAQYFDGIIVKLDGKNYKYFANPVEVRQVGDAIELKSGREKIRIETKKTPYASAYVFRSKIAECCASGGGVSSWNELTDIPDDFADGIDNVDDADNDLLNEINTAFGVSGSGFLTIEDTHSALQVPVTDIAPVQEIVGGEGIEVIDNGSGSFTINNTEILPSGVNNHTELRWDTSTGTWMAITPRIAQGATSTIARLNAIGLGVAVGEIYLWQTADGSYIRYTMN